MFDSRGMNKALKFSKKIWPVLIEMRAELVGSDMSPAQSLHRTPPPSDSRPSGVSEQKDRAGTLCNCVDCSMNSWKVSMEGMKLLRRHTNKNFHLRLLSSLRFICNIISRLFSR